MSKHTPGPWIMDRYRMVHGNDGDDEWMPTEVGTLSDWSEADANIAAAAPDLLGALEEIMFYEGGAVDALHDPYVNERAVDAIAKARGEK